MTAVAGVFLRSGGGCLAEAIPLSTRGAGILFDGRIDNRDELIRDLPCARDAGLPDAQLALEAWHAWGETTPAHLLGDFAFVVWDAARRSVFCARDPMGVRPLFYSLSPGAFVFAGDLRRVLAHPLVSHAPDEAMVADLLSGRVRSLSRTLYRAVNRLPHGHSLTVTAENSRESRYWRVDCGRELTLRHDEEYAAAFRDVFDRAVAVRARAAPPIGAYLSGGLDSSSVVATAVATAPALANDLTAFSIVFPGHPAADERAYSTAAARTARVSLVQISPPAFDPEEFRRQARARCDLPDFPNDMSACGVRRAMAERGIQVALTGLGGDYGLAGTCFQYADDLRAGRLAAFARRYRDIARGPDTNWHSARLLKGAVWPLLPLAVRRLLRPVARRLAIAPVPPHVRPELARRTGLHDVDPVKQFPPGQLARFAAAHAFDDGWAHMAIDMYQRGSAEFGIEDRHPFLDRRVIEFVIALPDEQRWQSGVRKYVLRRAMHDRLPTEVRDRTDASKGEFSHLFVQALDALGGERFFAQPLKVADNGWVGSTEARAMFGRMRALYEAGNIAYSDLAWHLWTTAALELWCRETLG